MNSLFKYHLRKRLWVPFSLLFFILIGAIEAKAQEKPPRPVTVEVRTDRPLQFGSFIQSGSFGTVTVDFNGSRSVTGSVIQPNISSSAFPSPAMFTIYAEPGTLITIVKGPDAFLTGSNGGKLKLTIGESSVSSPFIVRNQYTSVSIGGTLEVGSLSANPAGAYQGTFQVTFIQE